MGLETGSFIDDLVDTNPPSNDLASQGDDHIRLLKTVLKNTFPNADKAFRFPSADGDNNDVTLSADAQNQLYFADASGGAITVTMPTLDSGDAGWECSIIKSETSTNPVFIQPPSGLIRTGNLELSKTRRCIPRVRTRVFWDGSNWYADRAVNVPVGSLIPFVGSALPVGYEWPNGQTLSTSDYPDYANVRGSGTTPDHRGRVTAGKDDMGGSAANRLQDVVDGATLGASGGDEFVTLSTSELPAHSHTGTTDGQSADHTHRETTNQGSGSGVGVGISTNTNQQTAAQSTLGTSNDHTHTFTTNDAGSGDGHNNVQPTIIENFILVVE